MARKTANRDFTPIIEAARRWIDTCLIDDKALFSQSAIWTTKRIDEVRAAFVDHPDEGDDKFGTKLSRQMKDASVEAKLLMAEMLWIIMLFPSNVSPGKKREIIGEIWKLSEWELPASPLLSDEILVGVGNCGAAFNMQRWRELVFLINLTETVKAMTVDQRKKIFSDYDAFLALIEAVPEDGDRQFRHILRFFAFPDRVERMSINSHRRKILSAFRGKTAKELKKWSQKELDEGVLDVRREFESKNPDVTFDFYQSPTRELWMPTADNTKEEAGEPVQEAETSSDPEVAEGEDLEVAPYAIEHAAAELFMPRAKIEEALAQLRRKLNIVLQGPPGVGKTFAARRLAYLLLGGKDTSRVEIVQFHPSTSYEDFVLGMRPDGRGGFALKPGVFHRFCRRAQADATRPYVFVIDEINRANLAKVLGELMMLIEVDKRGEQFAVQLAYSEGSGDTFYLPPNLYIIGTMNTADRSLALVDYALRRRFAFVALEPDFGAGFKAALKAHGRPDELIQKICARIGDLNDKICKDTRSLGAGYQIGHSFFCGDSVHADHSEWYRELVAFELKPLLEEYWMDDPAKVASEVERLLE